MGSPFVPEVSVSVDETTGLIRAAYVRVRAGEAAETREVVEGRAFADYDAAGLLLGVELLAPCAVDVLDRIAATEPEAIRQFLRGGPPPALVSA